MRELSKQKIAKIGHSSSSLLPHQEKLLFHLPALEFAFLAGKEGRGERVDAGNILLHSPLPKSVGVIIGLEDLGSVQA